MKLVWLSIALLFLIACAPVTPEAPPEVEPEAQPILFECWDGSTVDASIDLCPPQPIEEPVEDPEMLPEAMIKAVLSVHFIDVGQGDSTLIVYPNKKTLLIDCGNTGKGDDIVNYLRSVGVNEIDVMLTTHADADHIGGCDEVMKLMKVNTVIENGQKKGTNAYHDFKELAQQKEYRMLTDDDYDFTLDPSIDTDLIVPYDDYGMVDDYNENSIALKLTYDTVSFLFTGDCEDYCENQLTRTENLNVDVLKVGHHGSKTSSNYGFLEEVTPNLAIISVNENNQYGHPHAEAIERISKHTDNIFSTAQSGTILVTTDGQTYSRSKTAKVFPVVVPVPVKETTAPRASSCVQLGCDADAVVVGSSQSDVYHQCHCSYASRISGGNLRCFNSIQEAVDAGYRPAKRC